MANFIDTKYNQSKITAVAVDLNDGGYLWIAFALKSGTCLLQKVSAHDITQVYFSVQLSVTSINSMKVLGSLLFIAVTHATIGAYLISVSNPLTSQTSYLKSEISLLESPIEVVTGVSTVYFMTAGISLAEPTQLATFDNNGNYLATINVVEDTVYGSSAVSVTEDASGDLWIVAAQEPPILYRVYLQSGNWLVSPTTLP